MSNHVRAITTSEFEAEVLQATEPVLVDFTTTWCSPCRALAPILERLAAEGGGRYKILKVDGDESPELAAQLRVKGFPTIVAFSGGKEVARHVGVTGKEKLLAMVEAGRASAVA